MQSVTRVWRSTAYSHDYLGQNGSLEGRHSECADDILRAGTKVAVHTTSNLFVEQQLRPQRVHVTSELRLIFNKEGRNKLVTAVTHNTNVTLRPPFPRVNSSTCFLPSTETSPLNSKYDWYVPRALHMGYRKRSSSSPSSSPEKNRQTC